MKTMDLTMHHVIRHDTECAQIGGTTSASAGKTPWGRACENWRFLLLAAVSLVLLTGGGDLSAQMVNVETPFVTTGERYFENFGVNFGFQFPGGRGNGSRVVGLGPNRQLMPNIAFRQNLGAFPPFGGFNPGAGANFGFGVRRPNGGGFDLGFSLAKGNTRTNVTQAPYVTMMNGGFGSISDTRSVPFVIGNIPVVGNLPGRPVAQPYENGVTRALSMGGLQPSEATAEYRAKEVRRPVVFGSAQSTAAVGDESVAAIKAARTERIANTKRQIELLVDQADLLLKQDRRLDARIELRKALKIAPDASSKRRLERLIKATRVKQSQR